MISFIAKIVAHFRVSKIQKTYTKAIKIQDHTLLRLIKKAANTKFGRDHKFTTISNYEDFKNMVPIRDYESIKKLSLIHISEPTRPS